MIIQKVQQNYTPKNYLRIDTARENFDSVLTQNNRFQTKISDVFIKNNYSGQIDFTGNSIFDKLMIGYLKRKTYKNSIMGSKRPYLSMDQTLAPMVTEVKIGVSPFEKIQAWDINPKTSKDYVIFLHGFSQNITNNQPLYKEIAKTRFGLLAIDYRGYGKNPRSVNIQEDDIVNDVNSSIKYLKDKGVQNIGIVGHSFGAYIGAKVSAKNAPSFLVMVSPMNSLEFWLKNVIKHPNKYKFEMGLIRYVKNFKDQYKKIFNISEYLKDNLTDIYVIQTYKDRYVRTSKVDQMVKDIPNLKQYTKLRGGGHRMDEGKINEVRGVLDNL